MKIKVYDAGHRMIDRYTVIFMNEKHENGDFNYLGMSEHPTHPQGVAMHGECKPGRHLGRRIKFDQLPVDCRNLVLKEYTETVKNKYFLRMGSDYLSDAKPYKTKKAAIEQFSETARELLRYGQKIEASIHVAPSMDQVSEYPNFILTVGPKNGIRCERA